MKCCKYVCVCVYQKPRALLWLKSLFRPRLTKRNQGPLHRSKQAPRDGAGPAGQTRAPQDESGLRWTGQDLAGRISTPLDGSWPQGTDQRPKGGTRTSQNEPGPYGTGRGTGQIPDSPRDGSGPRGKNQGPEPRRNNQDRQDRSESRGTNQDPTGSIGVVRHGTWPHRTDQGPEGRTRTPEENQGSRAKQGSARRTRAPQANHGPAR